MAHRSIIGGIVVVGGVGAAAAAVVVAGLTYPSIIGGSDCRENE